MPHHSPRGPLLGPKTVVRVLALTATALLFSQAVHADLTPQERRGKEIFLRGTSPSGGDVTALMGEAGVEVPASALPCANCHGRDGQGKPEGGVSPSNLTWDALTKSYGVRHESGREHPPYTLPLLKRAITMGIDPAGNELHVAMPRYRMSQQDMDDLLSYIQKLGTDSDPGISADTLKLGTILPPGGAAEATGKAISSVLEAYVKDLNEKGGLYGRKVVLETMELPGDPAARRAAVEKFLDSSQVFALVGPYMAGTDEDLADVVSKKEVPVVGPFTLHPQLGFPLNREIFYLFSGLAAQAQALLDHAAERRPNGAARGAIIFPENDYLESVADALDREAKEQAWIPLKRFSYPADEFDAEDLVGKLAKDRLDTVFFLDSDKRELELLKQAVKLRWRPDVYIPGSLVGREIFDAPTYYTDHVFLAFPTLPTDQSPHALQDFKKLVDKYKLELVKPATELSIYTAAQILVEGLKQAGRDLSREKLIEALEGFYDFETGLTPKISYGPNRRIGALGAYIITIDVEKKQFLPASGWISPLAR